MKSKTKAIVILILIIGIILPILLVIGGAFVIDLTDMHTVGAVLLTTGIILGVLIAVLLISAIAEIYNKGD